MITLTKKQIDKALLKIEKGLEQYLWIQNEIKNLSNVSKDREFQRKFNAFYRVRRGKDWQKKFYNLLEKNRKGDHDFKKVLTVMNEKINRVEASFASKLVATVNLEMPIIDSIVLKNIKKMGVEGMRLPYSKASNRIDKIVELHTNLKKLFVDFLKTENGKYLVKQFTKTYPKAKISKIKMLDFVLWKTRD